MKYTGFGRSYLQRLDQVMSGSLVLVLLSVAGIGAAMADQAGRQAMRLLGDQSFIGLEYPVLGVQEFCPLIVALVLAMRVGAGFSAELATLRSDDTWNALVVLRAQPFRRRALPMMLALPLGTAVLTVLSVFAWEVAGVVVMLARSGINPFTFIHIEVISPSLLGVLLLKSTLFGAAIGVGAARAALGPFGPFGPNGPKGRLDLGSAVTQGVVNGTMLVLAINLLVDVWWHTR
jgi:phospholipid/cholesterol/gamma-HCH transport system permease protein